MQGAMDSPVRLAIGGKIPYEYFTKHYHDEFAGEQNLIHPPDGQRVKGNYLYMIEDTAKSEEFSFYFIKSGPSNRAFNFISTNQKKMDSHKIGLNVKRIVLWYHENNFQPS